MKYIMLPVRLAVGYLGYEHRAAIVETYRAAYPDDPAKSAALDGCASRSRSFNRLDGDDRQRCYRQTFGDVVPRQLPPSASPAYAFSPSHEPANDIRRQQVNEGLIGSAHAAPAPVPLP